MKKGMSLFACMVILGITGAPNVMAQGGRAYRGAGSWGGSSNDARLFNPATVETISGTVVAVEHLTAARRASYGVHLTLRTGSETIDVHLGPSWFIEDQAIRISSNDTIEVRGSRVTYAGKPAMIAASVAKDGNVMRLRDANGIPRWGGARRRW